MSQSRGRAGLVTAVLLLTVTLSVGNLFFHALTVQAVAETGFTLGGPALAERLLAAIQDTYQRRPDLFLFFAVSPLVVGILLALWIGLRREGSAPVETEVAEAEEAQHPSAGALQLLALLQNEGRLIDFLEEDIAGYDDSQVGAAVRDIHGRCRDALHERMQIERIYEQEDGTSIEVASGFDPSLVRLTGNVHGDPPFRGTLQHAGWRATEVRLPKTSDVDPTVLAPAEVEIP